MSLDLFDFGYFGFVLHLSEQSKSCCPQMAIYLIFTTLSGCSPFTLAVIESLPAIP